MQSLAALHPPVRAPATLDRLQVEVFTIPTDAPESDGTLAWDHTTVVVVHLTADGIEGIGYSYADRTAGLVVDELLRPHVEGADVFQTGRTWGAMVDAVRNVGRQGIAATAISAVDIALWDLKARVLGVSLVDLLGAWRDTIPAYGSGGFTSYADARLRDQLAGWAAEGFRMVKIKVGRDPDVDPHRVDVARDAIGPETALFVDANGAFDRARALAAAEAFAARGVTWFEEPVSSDDVDGLRLLRDRAPAGMAIAAGEYGWDSFHFRRLLEAGAVDVLQADATRCLGITGFLAASALCEAHGVPLSTHCAPALHAHLACAASRAIHVEWFHDHARIERMLFEGAIQPRDGLLVPDRSRPGLGLSLDVADRGRWLDWRSA